MILQVPQCGQSTPIPHPPMRSDSRGPRWFPAGCGRSQAPRSLQPGTTAAAVARLHVNLAMPQSNTSRSLSRSSSVMIQNRQSGGAVACFTPFPIHTKTATQQNQMPFGISFTCGDQDLCRSTRRVASWMLAPAIPQAAPWLLASAQLPAAPLCAHSGRMLTLGATCTVQESRSGQESDSCHEKCS